LKTSPVYLERWETTVRPVLDGGIARIELSSVVANMDTLERHASLSWTLLDPQGKAVATARTPAQTVAPGRTASFQAVVSLTNPQIWSVDSPALYTAQVSVEHDGAVQDGEGISFGIRNIAFDTHGFWLNGRNLKIKGVCNHQDHAGVGSALPDRLQAFRVGVMQSMGCNAIRTAHNMPGPELVAACDRMGMMMMCETRQMSSSPEGMSQLAAMVKRYRNSPSVILWSIGNEENDLQGAMAEQGARIGRSMVALCHELDPTRPVTAAVNADNEKGVSEAVDVIGFNYHREFPDDFHKRHPQRPIISTEDASDVATRGEYTTDWKRNVVSSFDGDVPWKKSPENWWTFYATRDWTGGGFAWTGFDYRGEPSPFGWPSINSNFGIVDMCGFPKDYYYYYKAWWDKTPMLHLFPHWNWAGQEGKEMPVWVYSNLDEVELLVNGRSLGRQKVPPLGHLAWTAVYQPGAIEARGYRNGRRVLTERRETTGMPRILRLSADRTVIRADGEDICVLTVEALDNKGRSVPTADALLNFRISGQGTLIGVGNGNPNCLESDKAPRRSLFNGLAQLIVQCSKTPGSILVEASSEADPGLAPARLVVATRSSAPRPCVT
ncbi:MAG: glycoside hydrolase family 2 TIM barrel-domain containing protein, partial [Asticcacaulis sp.]